MVSSSFYSCYVLNQLGLNVVVPLPLVMLLPVQNIGVGVAVADDLKLCDVPLVGAVVP